MQSRDCWTSTNNLSACDPIGELIRNLPKATVSRPNAFERVFRSEIAFRYRLVVVTKDSRLHLGLSNVGKTFYCLPFNVVGKKGETKQGESCYRADKTDILPKSSPQLPPAALVPPASSLKTPEAPTISTVPEATKKALIENTDASKTSPAAAAQLAQDGRVLTAQEVAQFIQEGKASKTAAITSPTGAEVYVDGNKIGVTPLVFALIKRDAPRVITIKLVGYKTVEKTLVPDGKNIPIGIALDKQQ